MVSNRKIAESVLDLVGDTPTVHLARMVSAGWAALKVAKRLGAGKRVVTLLPDTGERYLTMDV